MASILSAAPAAPTPLAVREGTAALTVPVAAAGCDTFCDWCWLGGHWAVGVEPGEGEYARNDGWHMDCKSGTCSGAHGPFCPAPIPSADTFTEADFTSLVEAVLSDDATRIRALLTNHSGQLALNMPRSAIQIAACTGELWAHLPIPSELSKAIKDAE